MQEIAGGKGKDFCLQGKSPALQKVYLARCKLGSKNSSDCSWDLSSYLTVFDAQPDNFLKNLGFLMTYFSPISQAFIIWITLAPSPPWRPAPWVSRGSRQRARLRRSPFDGTPGSHGQPRVSPNVSLHHFGPQQICQRGSERVASCRQNSGATGDFNSSRQVQYMVLRRSGSRRGRAMHAPNVASWHRNLARTVQCHMWESTPGDWNVIQLCTGSRKQTKTSWQEEQKARSTSNNTT